jgi:methylglyoxal reductase
MLHRAPENDILPCCKASNIATLTYMSLEQGLLTGKVGMDRVFDAGEFRNNEAWNPWYAPRNRRRILDLIATWGDLTRKYSCSLAQLVLAWTASQAGVTHVLCGARRPEQILETARAGDMTLESGDLLRIRCDLEALGEPSNS